jgi:hypothetical protein
MLLPLQILFFQLLLFPPLVGACSHGGPFVN